MTLKDKRKELFQQMENGKFQDTLSSSEYEKIMFEIEKQDKEFIKKLKAGIKEETNQLWCLELIDKLTGELE